MSLPQNSQVVQVTENGDIKIKATNIAEAKVAVRELKLHKKQFALKKKDVNNQIAQIRAKYRLESARRGSMTKGSGGLSKFIRGIERANRDSARAQKENSIAPLEKEKVRLERIAAQIDGAILQLEKYILENSQ